MTAMSPHLTLALSCFAEADLRGYAIIDSGATKSMSGASLFTYLQEQIFESQGSDLVEIDYNDKTRFTYANNTKGASIGKRWDPPPPRTLRGRREVVVRVGCFGQPHAPGSGLLESGPGRRDSRWVPGVL